MDITTYLTKTRQKPSDFARKIGCSPRSIYNYMAGQLPRYAIAMKIIEKSGRKIEFKVE